ncbi:NAD(P)/FAD-dependent oxidoreductase [Alicyclobacillus ferrooxydans]|uniref:Dehydrogenase n=1 Tax=Alicyclobacillus ferrooxydans TaxID=471514 RepID=A0A0P9CTT9_9BACL|nr:NAD(P)-binding protein [Alicyclobacillus ferrooxydans]KPV43078.1 dehydrogenase [Alicyclobacillus ferrooxydans]
MKVAIMGAGLSGLSCAIELEKHGIEPYIFERRSRVGDRFINAEVFAGMYSRPILDEVRYLSEELGIFVQPASNIKDLIVYSPKKKAVLSGPVGFVSIRGRHRDALENQLARQVHSPIHYHSEHTYEELLREYTHVVLATGDADYVKKIQNFHEDATVTLIGVTVEGEFTRNTVFTWFDNRFAPHGGYGFLIPFSPTEATVVLAFAEYKGLQAYDKTALWEMFFNRVCTDLNQNLKVTDQFEVNEYVMGIAESPRLGNTFFVGNCYGALMPGMGFGQFASILTGVYAAKDIVGLGRYETLTNELRHSYDHSRTLRRMMETLDNDGLDNFVQMLNGVWGRMLVHSRVNVLKWASYAARPWVALHKGPESQ